MQANPSPKISRAERDPYFFIGFVTLVVVSMYAATLFNKESVRQPGILVIFTGLTLAHIMLHWQLGRIINQPRKTFWYILLQGVLAFVILVFVNNLAWALALFMMLIGESIGLLGLSPKAMLAAVYNLGLLTVNLIYLFGWDEVGMLMLNILPTAVFVILAVTFYMRQNEAREQAQLLAADLESANQKLAEYAERVEELTLAAERQRIARELHDTLSQGLSGLVLQLEAIKAHLEAGRGERAAAIIDQSLSRARSTLADSRAAIDDLRAIPGSLPEALRAKAQRFTQATGIPCKISLALGDTALPPKTGDHLLRVLNEALTNVSRHAQAAHVWVKLEAEDNHLELEIQDDGKGFNARSVSGSGHYGLLGIRERARLMGGALEIDSGSGQGTLIRLIVPIPEEN